jgi:hypothetical protein
LLFTELVLTNKTLVKYEAKNGFDDILARIRVTGSGGRIRTYNPLVNSETLYH